MKKLTTSMKHMFSSKYTVVFLAVLLAGAVFLSFSDLSAVFAQANTNVEVSQGALGFKIPDFATILTFFIRFFFVLAGLAALIYGLWGAFTYVTSGGEQENVDKARQKIVAALLGVILIVVVLAAVVTFEQFIFQQRVCFGLSCPVQIPGILEACVPNPQYKRSLTQTEFDTKCGGDPALSGTVNTTATNECCEAAQDADFRVTTGWQSGTKAFGSNDCRVCCNFGDEDGDQICDTDPGTP